MSLYAGFDLGGTHLKHGVINQKGKVIFKDKIETPTKIEELIGGLERIWKKLKKQQREPIAACGFGFPGIFHKQEKKIFQAPHFPELDGFDLHPALSRFIDVPFFLNNDANLAIFAEYQLGAGKDVQSLLLLTIGTGIGTGIILDGKLWEGSHGFAGELGHAPVNPQGDKCPCGSRGCLETEVSASKIVKTYKELKNTEEEIDAEDVFQRAKKGDMEAREAYALAGYYLGIGLSITINFLNPEKILLGGGVMEGAEFILPPALREAKKRSFAASFGCCRIEKAGLGNDAGFIGAALWARNQLKECRA